ncbi:MAG: NAD+ synthase [Actinomycetia bacterium]|nr:NAD+ synthase [Actinomycetes bacterium]
MENLRLYAAQINPIVGDFKGNFDKIASHIEQAKNQGVDILAFPELAITGYPPEDLVLKPAFIEENLKYLDKIKKLSDNIVIIIGFVNKDFEIYNSAAICSSKKIISIYNKQFLPNYSVFDEERYFQKGLETLIFELRGMSFGVNICEDIYYSSGPTKSQAILGGANLIINISASPYHVGKVKEREKILFTRAVDNRVNIMYVNLVGGQDELVFDGNSMIVNEKGKILARAKSFEEDYFIFDLDTEEVNSTRLQDAKFKNQRDSMKDETAPLKVIKINDFAKNSNKTKNNSLAGITRYDITFDRYKEIISCQEEEIFKALALGTKDYISKNGFSKVVLGLSGGIDSALTAVVAVFAIGKHNVTGVLMPSEYSSKGSIGDSLLLASNIGIDTLIVPISDVYKSYLDNLGPIFKTDKINITKENLQARIRGNILMGLSNENGWLVLSTGNKSEISVGYCTLYGDMVGGFSPIKDIYKTLVYRICNFVNRKYSNIIPETIINKVPSAELKPDQKDEDKLPPYDKLDEILKSYIEEEKDYHDIVKCGFDEKMARDVINMVDFNEYKRRQGAPGIKITQRAFGRDRRYPITNKFKLK